MFWNPSSTKGRFIGIFAASLALAALPACSALGGPFGGEADLPPGLRTVDAAWIEGLSTGERTVSVDGKSVTSRYPQVPGAADFTTEVRTAMAERETAFLTGDGGTSLEQEAKFLVASGGVLGARITARTDGAVEGTSRWYDAGSGEALPWTALLNGDEAIDELGAQVSRVLRDEHGVAPNALPPGLPAPASRGLAADDSVEPALVDPEAAWQSAADREGSALEDIGFNAAGELVVSFSPGEAGEGEEDVQVPVPDSEVLLSRFGRSARTAVMEDARSVDLGPADGPVAGLDCDRVPCVALTFDDGPGEDTGLLLEHLDEYSAKATFYVLGSLTESSPETVRSTAEAGHEIGIHTWKHDNLALMGGDAVRDDVERTAAAIKDATGVEVTSMRPPYGSFNETTQANVDYPMILWDVDTLDWQHMNKDKTIDTAVSETQPGSIVLFHDIHRPTVDAIPAVLEQLQGKGYHFVTVSELFADTTLEPGVAYMRRDQGA
ncbi:polysaccharide deacetylase family protein [Actinorugispora endophytica]|uniref:Peptidoglycan/xylan/chitin deacetylase (PgdA/CDA1 family) n=1 Tax=Actinorugispora endophytica TaxID=1605990 RepID=A0A4R6UXP6_9ACTN|nr:polysaccharide deacetylase family protein [Actinorugispora endophytica]TDQ50789.1 peptidoglycan/xylan/chitin deacetylase (PgdA/CDA1 family) [Actinorugispora endophytica]